MHVTLLKPGSTPVPPPLYGGTQRTLYCLGKALVELGHKVTLIAHPDSFIPGAELIPSQASDAEAMRLVPDSTDIIHVSDHHIMSAPKPFLVRSRRGIFQLPPEQYRTGIGAIWRRARRVGRAYPSAGEVR